MKTIEYEFNGQRYHLCMNGAALYDIYDRYGYTGSVYDFIKGNSKKAFEAVCWILAKLAEQGELSRRWMKLDRGAIPSPEFFKLHLRPADVAVAKLAIKAAVDLGFSREEAPEDERVDLGLLELEQKKHMSRAKYLQMVTQFLGYTVREGMLLMPGQAADLVDLEVNRRGLVRREGD